MRHNKKINHLGRTSTHRKAMLANMAVSLIRHKRITTTLAKAKALRVYVEPLLTKAKNDTTHSRRTVFSYLQNKEAVTELFRDVAVKIADRPGGYTRILRTGYRFGDNAEMCIIELVDYNENMLVEKTAKKSTRTRRSRKTADSGADIAVKEVNVPKAVEEIASDKEEAEVIEVETEETPEPVSAEDVKEETVQKEEVIEAKAEESEAPAEDSPENPAEEAKAE